MEKVDELPLESRQVFADILNKKISDARINEIREDIIEGREEFKAGKARSGSVRDLMKEILG